MASILKVDTLQKPDGSTPTAADLGIDVAGTIVQQVHASSNAHSYGNTTAYLEAVSTSFTPKYANSKIVVIGEIATRLFDNQGVNYYWVSPYVAVNGSPLSGQSNERYKRGQNYNSTTWIDVREIIHVTHSWNVTTTDTIQIGAGVRGYLDTYQTEVNEDGNFYSHIVIYEIAQ